MNKKSDDDIVFTVVRHRTRRMDRVLFSSMEYAE